MRKLEFTNEQTSILNEILLNSPLEQGYTIEDIRISLRIGEELKKDVLLLEDADWSWLRNRMSVQKWRIASIVIVDLMDKIEKALPA